MISRSRKPFSLGWRFAAGLALVATATAPCRAGFATFEAAGADAAAITPTRDAFRAAVGGGTVAGANGSFGGLRREINWDGVPDALVRPQRRCPPTSSTSTRPAASSSARRAPASSSAPTPGRSRPRCSASRTISRPSARRSCSRPSTATSPTSSSSCPARPPRPRPAPSASIFVDVEVAGLTKVEFFDQSNTLIFTRERPGRRQPGAELPRRRGRRRRADQPRPDHLGRQHDRLQRRARQPESTTSS